MPVKSASSQVPSARLRLEQVLDAAARRPRRRPRPAAIRPSTAQAVCEAVGLALAHQRRVVVAAAALAPAAAGLLDRFEPVGRLAQRRVVHREVDRLEALEDLPGAVDVVHAPAAVPAAVGLLRPPEIVERRGRPPGGRRGSRASPSSSSTRAVMSGQLGSSIALWSANGTLVRTSLSMSTSNAAQPPSRFCIASSQFDAALRSASRTSGVVGQRASAAGPAAPSPCRRCRGRSSLRYSKYQPLGSTPGPADAASRPASRTSLLEQPVARRGAGAGWSSGSPASARAMVAIAVSQTGETQGWSRTVSSSSIMQVVELLAWPTASRASRRRSRGTAAR